MDANISDLWAYFPNFLDTVFSEWLFCAGTQEIEAKTFNSKIENVD